MDPISAFVTAASVATSIFGGMKQASAANKEAQAQQQIAGLEIQADQQRRQAMELDASRKSMEVLRNSQRARATALTNATSSGSQFGSGLQGGYGQIGGSTGFNLLGISQNKTIGENLFNINDQIDQQRMLYAQASGQMATGQGISSIGSMLGQNNTGLTNLVKTGMNMIPGF